MLPHKLTNQTMHLKINPVTGVIELIPISRSISSQQGTSTSSIQRNLEELRDHLTRRQSMPIEHDSLVNVSLSGNQSNQLNITPLPLSSQDMLNIVPRVDGHHSISNNVNNPFSQCEVLNITPRNNEGSNVYDAFSSKKSNSGSTQIVQQGLLGIVKIKDEPDDEPQPVVVSVTASNVSGGDIFKDLEMLQNDDIHRLDPNYVPPVAHVHGLLDKNIVQNAEPTQDEHQHAQQLKSLIPGLANVCPRFIAKIQSAAGPLLERFPELNQLQLQQQIQEQQRLLEENKKKQIEIQREQEQVQLRKEQKQLQLQRHLQLQQEKQQQLQQEQQMQQLKAHIQAQILSQSKELEARKNEKQKANPKLLPKKPSKPSTIIEPKIHNQVVSRPVKAATSPMTSNVTIVIDKDDDEDGIDYNELNGEHVKLDDLSLEIGTTSRGKPSLKVRGYTYYQNRKFNDTVYWLCCEARDIKCKGKLTTRNYKVTKLYENHNHPREDGSVCPPVVVEKFRGKAMNTCDPLHRSKLKRKLEEEEEMKEDEDVGEDSEEDDMPPSHLSLFHQVPISSFYNAVSLNLPNTRPAAPSLSPSPPPPQLMPPQAVDNCSLLSIDSVASNSSDPEVLREIEREGVGQLQCVQEVVDSYHHWHRVATSHAVVKVKKLVMPIVIAPASPSVVDSPPASPTGQLIHKSPSLSSSCYIIEDSNSNSTNCNSMLDVVESQSCIVIEPTEDNGDNLDNCFVEEDQAMQSEVLSIINRHKLTEDEDNDNDELKIEEKLTSRCDEISGICNKDNHNYISSDDTTRLNIITRREISAKLHELNNVLLSSDLNTRSNQPVEEVFDKNSMNVQMPTHFSSNESDIKNSGLLIYKPNGGPFCSLQNEPSLVFSSMLLHKSIVHWVQMENRKDVCNLYGKSNNIINAKCKRNIVFSSKEQSMCICEGKNQSEPPFSYLHHHIAVNSDKCEKKKDAEVQVNLCSCNSNEKCNAKFSLPEDCSKSGTCTMMNVEDVDIISVDDLKGSLASELMIHN